MNAYGRLLGLVLASFIGMIAGCRQRDSDDGGAAVTAQTNVAAEQTSAEGGLNVHQLALVNRLRPEVESFCGDCHVMPRPSSSAREDWPAEVEQGFMLYRSSGRTDLAVPDQDEVLSFFQAQAPRKLAWPMSIRDYPATSLPLRPAGVRMAGNRPPGVTNVRWIDLGMKGSPALVYCDIGSAAVKAHWPQAEGAPTERLATLLQPVHVEPCDLDADGLVDLVVADIGEFNANDSDLGRVVWLRRKSASEGFETIVLQDGLSRVSDVRPGDFDGDGDLDLLVAAFGWRNSGAISLLENTGPDADGRPQFRSRLIDQRHGAVHVPPVDINADGHLDFVALISQDHEVVEAFINDGKGNFKTELIYRAPDPGYGSSGIELVDMDGDGDLDVLYTNGDSFDRGAKPYHSVQWLENEGSFPYTHHHVCLMPGVLNARAGDFDGDGDMDIVAGSLLASEFSDELPTHQTPSIVMLMQTEPGVFVPTKVETGRTQHISIETGDFDGDGNLDFAVGNFLREGGLDQPDLILWWNRP